MKILVTGGSGFIGSHLLSNLCRQGGHSLFSVDWREPIERLSGVNYYLLDFCDYDKLLGLFNEIEPEVICHLGALPSIQQSIKEPVVSMNSNIRGTYTVLEAARQVGVSRVVFASSAAVYGQTAFEYSGRAIPENVLLQPLNGYALAKKIGEELLALWSSSKLWSGPDGVSLRFFNVFGPRQRNDSPYRTCIETFLTQWKDQKPFTIVPDGQQRRDLVYVSDIVEAIKTAIFFKGKLSGEVFNIGCGQNYSINEIADIIGGTKYERIMIEPRSGEIKESLADNSKVRKVLGWEPKTSFKDGIKQLKLSLQNDK